MYTVVFLCRIMHYDGRFLDYGHNLMDLVYTFHHYQNSPGKCWRYKLSNFQTPLFICFTCFIALENIFFLFQIFKILWFKKIWKLDFPTASWWKCTKRDSKLTSLHLQVPSTQSALTSHLEQFRCGSMQTHAVPSPAKIFLFLFFIFRNENRNSFLDHKLEIADVYRKVILVFYSYIIGFDSANKNPLFISLIFYEAWFGKCVSSKMSIPSHLVLPTFWFPREI